MSIKVYSMYDFADIAADEVLMAQIGFDDCSTKSNEQYFAPGGDCWYDPNYVVVNNVELPFYGYDTAVILGFDPEKYPEHKELVVKWEEHSSTFRLLKAHGILGVGLVKTTWWDEAAQAYLTADQLPTNRIMYRGGSGYVYGCYVPNDTESPAPAL